MRPLLFFVFRSPQIPSFCAFSDSKRLCVRVFFYTNDRGFSKVRFPRFFSGRKGLTHLSLVLTLGFPREYNRFGSLEARRFLEFSLLTCCRDFFAQRRGNNYRIYGYCCVLVCTVCHHVGSNEGRADIYFLLCLRHGERESDS